MNCWTSSDCAIKPTLVAASLRRPAAAYRHCPGAGAEPAGDLFDEPTSALDPELVGGYWMCHQAGASGTTTVVVTHELALPAGGRRSGVYGRRRDRRSRAAATGAQPSASIRVPRQFYRGAAVMNRALMTLVLSAFAARRSRGAGSARQ